MGQKRIRIALIGAGHWGKNHLRNFSASKRSEVTWVCDPNEASRAWVQSGFSSVRVSGQYQDCLKDPDVDAVVVSTPATTHCEIALQCLRAGKDVLLEKPMAVSTAECAELVQEARSRDRVLMIGHTFLFNDGVRKIKSLLESGEIGDVYFLKAVRSHLGLIRDDVSSVWDLATHDLSIFRYLMETNPRDVIAAGGCYLKKDREDVAFITLRYGKALANIHVSWMDSNKQRTIEVVGSKGRILFDDLNVLEPIRVFQRGIAVEQDAASFGEFKYLLRDGDIVSPNVKMTEPLRNQGEHFLDCVETRRRPLSDGLFGSDIVATLAEIEKALHRPVKRDRDVGVGLDA